MYKIKALIALLLGLFCFHPLTAYAETSYNVAESFSSYLSRYNEYQGARVKGITPGKGFTGDPCEKSAEYNWNGSWAEIPASKCRFISRYNLYKWEQSSTTDVSIGFRVLTCADGLVPNVDFTDCIEVPGCQGASDPGLNLIYRGKFCDSSASCSLQSYDFVSCTVNRNAEGDPISAQCGGGLQQTGECSFTKEQWLAEQNNPPDPTPGCDSHATCFEDAKEYCQSTKPGSIPGSFVFLGPDEFNVQCRLSEPEEPCPDGQTWFYQEQICLQDTDGDGIPDVHDSDPTDPEETGDSDGDGTPDDMDDFPNDPTENQDSDGDGIGDNSDPSPFTNDYTSSPPVTRPTPITPTGPSTEFNDSAIVAAINQTNELTATGNAQLNEINQNTKATSQNVSKIPGLLSEGNQNTKAIGQGLTEVSDKLTEINDSISDIAGGEPEFNTGISDGLSGFYTSDYPNGFSDVWDNNKAAFDNSEMVTYINSWKIEVQGQYAYPQFCLNIQGLINLGCHQLKIDPRVLPFIRIILIISGLFLARKITLGA